MADFVFVSPGVFTKETDLTFRSADVDGPSLALIAPRAKGPAMVPVKVRDQDEDAMVFGPPDKTGRDFGAYTAQLYLRQAVNPLTQIRLLGQEGTGITTGYQINGGNGGTYAVVASGSNAVCLIQSSGAVTLAGDLTSSVDSLAVSIPGYGEVTASLNRNDNNYVKKVLNTDPSQFDTQKHYVFAVYDYADKTAMDNVFAVSEVTNANNFTDAFITGATTTVISQPFDSTEYDLFGFGSRFAGDSANSEIKVSIRDIKKSPNPDQNDFGTFTVVVRRFFDNDRSPAVLESFPACNLDPTSRNYVVRRIGDRYRTWNEGTLKFDEFGDYPNQSSYIYITPSTDLKNGNVPGTALPWGFKGYRKPTSATISGLSDFPSLPYVQNLLYKGGFTTRVYWGVEVIANASGAVNHGVVDRLKRLPDLVTKESDSNFSLKYVSASVENLSGFSNTVKLTEGNLSNLSTSIAYNNNGSVNPSTSGPGGFTGYLSVDNIENTSLAKFTLPIADGFDGVDIYKENPFDPSDMTSTTSYQVHSYRTAVNMLSNPDELDLNELVLPGVWATNVTDFALNMVEDRADVFYLMDITGSTIDAAVADVTTRQLDTNYASVWYPWVRLFDDVNNRFVLVPPTVVMPAVLAYSDRVSFPWFAPAGMSRGGLGRFGVSEAKEKLNRNDLNTLYENRINPLASFPNEGVVVWGQKTLQVQPSALDRINVRRLLLRLRKQIARIGRTLIFEPNVARTWQRFENQVNPILDRVRQNAGLDDFRVILNNETTTESLVERNIIFGKIVIRPTRTAEQILLDFTLTNNVAAFQEL